MSSIRDFENQSINEKKIIQNILVERGIRIDGRKKLDMRKLRLHYTRSECQAGVELQWGKTRVFTVITGEIIPPYPDRPNEGFLHFNIEYSPMACLTNEMIRPSSPCVVEIHRMIERGIRDSHALDVEALCISPGEKCWSIRCDIHILDHNGNIIDASVLATMAALQHFRLPQVTIHDSDDYGGHSYTEIHHTDEKEPIPLPLHHIPICITFALFSGGRLAIVDPTEREEAVMEGKISFSLNAHKELCLLHKIGGVAMSPEFILQCCRDACPLVEELNQILKESLELADKKAYDEKLARVRGTAAPQSVMGLENTQVSTLSYVNQSTPMDIAEDAKGIKFLDFAHLHTAIHIKEDEEPAKPQEDTETWNILKKAAERTEMTTVIENNNNNNNNNKDTNNNLNMNKDKKQGKVFLSDKLNDAAMDEFDEMASKLQQRKTIDNKNNKPSSSVYNMDSDEDSEEETIEVLQGSEFNNEMKKKKKEEDISVMNVDEDSDDSGGDLVSAIKKKPKKKGKKGKK